MAAKKFEVGDVLPATTQLRISWTTYISFGIYDNSWIYTDLSFVFQNSLGNIYIRDDSASGNLRLIYHDSNGVFIAPFTDYGGDHAYCDIDISTWDINKRTISRVDTSIGRPFRWEDIEPKGYTITFEENGGSTVTDLTEQTALPSPLPTPIKSGYTFVGWYYDSDFTNEAFADDELTVNVTLYAKWTPTYTITFEENGGSTVTDLTEQTALPTPLPTTTKANHVFAGWYYDNLFTQKATAGDELIANVTLYAKWYTPTTWCEDIADAIREKEGSSEPIKHVDFPERILAISGGGVLLGGSY